MKKLAYISLLFVSVSYAQKNHFNLKKGLIANGYDVVAYFNETAKVGSPDFATNYKNATFQFSSKSNLDKFTKNPEKYTPQYGGYCAYAIGAKGKKVKINPETFEIRDGKLYLFYNKGKTNTLQLWLVEGAEQLQQKADKNWQKLINK